MLVNQQSSEAARRRAETELQQLREKFEALELHLTQRGSAPVLPKHTAEIGVQSGSPAIDVEVSSELVRLAVPC